jgi:hypothetical protein
MAAADQQRCSDHGSRLDTHHFVADPRSMPLPDRRALCASMHREQAAWLERLGHLVEPPQPDHDFPAFLLATAPFAELAQRIGQARSRSQLPADVADQLDWFVHAYRDYLLTADGEDVFAGPRRR